MQSLAIPHSAAHWDGYDKDSSMLRTQRYEDLCVLYNLQHLYLWSLLLCGSQGPHVCGRESEGKCYSFSWGKSGEILPLTAAFQNYPSVLVLRIRVKNIKPKVTKSSKATILSENQMCHVTIKTTCNGYFFASLFVNIDLFISFIFILSFSSRF